MILNDNDYRGPIGKIKKMFMIALYLSLGIPSMFLSLLNPIFYITNINNEVIINKIIVEEREERFVAGTQMVRDKSRALRQKVQMIEEPIYKIRKITKYRVQARINTATINNPQVLYLRKLLARLYVFF